MAMEGDFHGTVLQEIVKNIILSFSGLGLGAALWLAIYDIKKALSIPKGHTRRLWLSRGGFVICFIGIIGLVAEALFRRAEPLPVEWRVLLYAALIVGAAITSIGVVYESRRSDQEEEKKGRYL